MNIYEDKRTCAICGTTSKQIIFRSASQYGTDLDTRPGQTMRWTMHTWVQSCPSCGYCAQDISKEILQASQIIESAQYRDQVNHEDYPELANYFLCWAIIQGAIADYSKAGWGAMYAAWTCDDAEMKSPAIACRLRAMSLFQEARTRKLPFAKDAGVEEAILADLLRRTKQFELVKKVCTEGLGKKPHEIVRQMLDFQIVLAERMDEKCYTTDDAQKYTTGR